jgi:hypothetical protein
MKEINHINYETYRYCKIFQIHQKNLQEHIVRHFKYIKKIYKNRNLNTSCEYNKQTRNNK